MKETCVIVGASHAGTQVAMRLRRLGWQGAIRLIGDEPHLPYHRPPLSKDYLKGLKTTDKILLHAEEAYAKSDIELMLDQRVISIDRDASSVGLRDGESIPYDKLILAIGSHPRKLPVSGAELEGVYYLRSATDVDRIRARAKTSGRAVIIGGGYIGLEVAASLRSLGVEVTLLEAQSRVLQRVTSKPVSQFFSDLHREEGVDIREGAQAEEILGDETATGVKLSSGEVIDATLVIVGIGIVPNTAIAEAAGLSINNGIEVNAQCRTSDPDILAAGDCASFVHPRYKRLLRLESVQNANDQGLVIAKTLCGEEASYDAVPWFWSDQYDVKLQIAGLAEDAETTVVRASPEEKRKLSVLYIKNNRLLAVDAMNNPRDFVMGKKLIAQETLLDLEKSADADVSLTDAVVRSGTTSVGSGN